MVMAKSERTLRKQRHRSVSRPHMGRSMTKKPKHISKKLAIAFAIAVAAMLVYIKIQPYTHDAKQRVELESKVKLLTETQQNLLKEQVRNDKQYRRQQKRLKEIKLELKKTEEALEAKRSTPVVYAEPRTAITGNKEVWLKASGIPEDQWWAVDYIVSRESGWNPQAVNQSSGACSLAQALPCSKLPCELSDPVCQLKWQRQYVNGRYGGYPQAVAFWKKNHWY